MKLNYECSIIFSAYTRHENFENPGQWLGDLVFHVLKKYDESLTRDSLSVDVQFMDTEPLIDPLYLKCENFLLAVDDDEDGNKILAKIAETIETRLNKKAHGSMNIDGHLMNWPPEISAYAYM